MTRQIALSTPRIGAVVQTSPGNLPAVWVWTTKTVWFGSGPVQKPDPLLLGRPNAYLYPSTCGLDYVWLDPSVPISCSGFRDFLFIMAFRYPNVYPKILTLVLHWLFLMYWPPLESKTTESHCLPHGENMSQWSVNDFWSCILWQSEWQLDADIHKWGIGCIDKQKREWHTPCPILKMSVSGASMIIGLASWLIWVVIGCRHS